MAELVNVSSLFHYFRWAKMMLPWNNSVEALSFTLPHLAWLGTDSCLLTLVPQISLSPRLAYSYTHLGLQPTSTVKNASQRVSKLCDITLPFKPRAVFSLWCGFDLVPFTMFQTRAKKLTDIFGSWCETWNIWQTGQATDIKSLLMSRKISSWEKKKTYILNV